MLLAALSLAACGGEQQAPEESEQSSTESAESTLPNPDAGAEDKKELLEPQGAMPFEMPVLPASAADNIPEYDEVHGVIPAGQTEAGEPYGFNLAEPIVTSDEELVGTADNVLVGEVVEDLGDNPVEQELAPDGTEVPPLATREFVVEVSEEVKGSLEDYQIDSENDDGTARIVVNQLGGQLHPGLPVELFNGDPLLQVGSEYLFLLGWDDALSAFVIVAQPQGDVLLGDADHKENVVARFQTAFENEVTLDEVIEARSDEESEDSEEPDVEVAPLDDPNSNQ